MDEDAQRKMRQDAIHRELERRSMDTFMVYNPTDEDYLLEWDRRYFRIPNRNKDMGFGPGRMELERYLTEKYAREMKDKLIGEMAEREGQEMLDARKKQGFPDFKDKYVENVEVWNKVIKTNDPKMTEKIYEEVILGLVREFGMDQVPEQRGETMDTRTLEQRTFDNMKKKYNEPRPQQAVVKEILKKTAKLQEVTNDAA